MPTALSDDGRFVLFLSSGDVVAGPDEVSGSNAYLRDTLAATTVWLHDPTLAPSAQRVVRRTLLLSGDGSTAIVEGIGLDGAPGTVGRIYAFDVASQRFTPLASSSEFEDAYNLSDITRDGRLLVGTTSDGYAVRVLDTQLGTGTNLYEPAEPRVVLGARFVGNDTRISFTENQFASEPELWTMDLVGSDLTLAPTGAPGIQPSIRVVADGGNCVVVQSQSQFPPVVTDVRLVNFAGGSSSTTYRSFTDSATGALIGPGSFTVTDIADDCRTVVGRLGPYALAQADLVTGTLTRLQSGIADFSGTDSGGASISGDGRAVLLETRDALVPEDDNDDLDGYIWTR